ncbi:MAG TPA: hypothetical protein VM537_09850, partial [Anaerolineae bacterium]|nr:hypothetical protein [Anaerolineae bacterium]
MIAKIPPDHEITALVENFIDHERWCKEHLTIRDKAGMEVPLQLSPSQLKIHALAQRQEARGIPFRAVVLKARQIHMSVGVASLIFRKIAFMEGQRAVTVAHQTDASSQIWGYYQQFYESYQPRSAQDLEILRLTRSHKDQLLEFEGGGYVKVYTAGNRKIGRASSLRFLHLSEYGFWVDAPQVMTGLLQSVPDDPGTMAIIESTANGVGGPFWEVSQMAQSADPGDWCFLFFAWHEHPEYVREPTSQKVFQDSLTGEELDLRRQHQLSLRQLCWRRWCIKNKCEGKIDRFRQEYPSTPEEAFLVSGRTVFSIPKLREMPIIRDPLHGRLERVRHGTKTKLQFLPHEDGELRIWKRPEPGKRYSIGADTAEGLDASDDAGSGDPDYCVAVVGDMETGEQIATWRARINPSTFADHLAALGEWYNWAFLVPEVN